MQFKKSMKPIDTFNLRDDVFYNEYFRKYEKVIFEKIIKDKREQPATFFDGSVLYYEQELVGAAVFFNKKLGLSAFTLKPNNNYFIFNANRKSYGTEYFSTHYVFDGMRGIAVLTGKCRNGKKLAVIDIEGPDKDKMLDYLIDKLNIEHPVVDVLDNGYHLYFYSSYSGKNVSIELPFMYKARVQVLANGAAFYPTPHGRVTPNIHSYEVMEGVFVDGKQTSWKHIDTLPEVKNLHTVIEELKKDTIRYRIPNNVYRPYNTDIYINANVYRYFMDFIAQKGSIYSIIDRMNDYVVDISKRGLLRKDKRVSVSRYQPNISDAMEAQGYTNESDYVYIKNIEGRLPVVTDRTNSRMTIVYDILQPFMISLYNYSLNKILNYFKLDTMKNIEDYTADSIDTDVEAFYSMMALPAAKEIKYNTYISEHKDKVLDIYTKYSSRKILVVAPTGAGKTRAFLTTALENKIKVIYAVPYTSQVEQLSNTYNILGVKAGVEVSRENITDTLVCTYDQLSAIMNNIDASEWVLVIDEVHNLIQSTDFRPVVKYIMSFTDVKSIIGITATPETAIDKDLWEIFYKFVPEVKKDIFNNVYVKIVKKDLINTFVKAYKKLGHKDGTTDIVFVNDTSTINKLEVVFKSLGYTTDVIYSYVKNVSESYKTIIDTETVPNVDVIFTTSVIADGVNIVNNNIGNVYMLSEYNGITIRQFMARFRNGFNNFYYFTIIDDKAEPKPLVPYDVLVSSMVNERKATIALYNIYTDSNYKWHNIISKFDLQNKLNTALSDIAIIKDETEYVLDMSVVLKLAQQSFYNVIFHTPKYITLFFEYFFNKTPKFTLENPSKGIKEVRKAKETIKMLKDTFNTMLPQKAEELAAYYIGKIKPDWLLDTSGINTDINFSQEVKDLMKIGVKFKYVSNKIYDVIAMVNAGMSWYTAGSIAAKEVKLTSKLSKQLYHLAQLEVMDIFEYYNDMDKITQSLPEKALYYIKKVGDSGQDVHYQSFELILEQLAKEANTTIAEVERVLSVKDLMKMFKLLYDYEEKRQRSKKFVYNPFSKSDTPFKVVYDKARHRSYTDVKRKTINSIAESIDLTDSERAEYIGLLTAQYAGYKAKMLEQIFTAYWETVTTVKAEEYNKAHPNHYLERKQAYAIMKLEDAPVIPTLYYNLVLKDKLPIPYANEMATWIRSFHRGGNEGMLDLTTHQLVKTEAYSFLVLHDNIKLRLKGMRDSLKRLYNTITELLKTHRYRVNDDQEIIILA